MGLRRNRRGKEYWIYGNAIASRRLLKANAAAKQPILGEPGFVRW